MRQVDICFSVPVVPVAVGAAVAGVGAVVAAAATARYFRSPPAEIQAQFSADADDFADEDQREQMQIFDEDEFAD
ncbi:putative transmembrane protein [Gregarina niphandrodes]|uniref:Transmembrane protein n=1 Tax=Gregarina niphandrodes TaxID=110365 RepID=A0A023AYN8_GRENI|nr:putative transmembrane protein [Gregarina niphandrodes]EZG43782.1 putative transmembrane protein [Gregarina niphandrodes]|eukprot:XP_011134607.1 putative transmembrane protein [Gregarina niphandrodes]